MGDHFPLPGMASIQNSDNQGQWGCGELGPLVHSWWGCKVGQLMWDKVCWFLEKSNTELQCDPSIPVLPKWNKILRHMCGNARCKSIQNPQKWATSPLSTSLDAWTECSVHLEGGLFSHKREWSRDTAHYDWILDVSCYVWDTRHTRPQSVSNLENTQNRQIRRDRVAQWWPRGMVSWLFWSLNLRWKM